MSGNPLPTPRKPPPENPRKNNPGLFWSIECPDLNLNYNTDPNRGFSLQTEKPFWNKTLFLLTISCPDLNDLALTK